MKKVLVVIVLVAVGAAILLIFRPWSDAFQPEIQKEARVHSHKGKQIHEEMFFLENPLTSNLQRVHMFYTAMERPAVILVPGGGKSSSGFFQAALDGAQDFVVFTFDPLGRGESQGVETMHGKEDQAFLYEVYRYAKERSNGSVSVASFSFGIAMVAGAVADYDMSIDVWVDWEGPHERTFIAHLCMESREDMQKLSLKEKRIIRSEMLKKISKGTAPGECANDEYWAEREAFYKVEEIETSQIQLYVRLQGRNDHVHQNFTDHALEMVNKMTELGFTTRLNDGPETMGYTEKSIVEFLYGPFDRVQKALDVIREYYTKREVHITIRSALYLSPQQLHIHMSYNLCILYTVS